MKSSNWQSLNLDTAAVPQPLEEARFERWMGSQRVFVSSVMDA